MPSTFAFVYEPKLHDKWTSIDIRESSQNMPFHLSIRPDRRVLVANAMKDNVWGDEFEIDFEFDPEKVVDIEIVILSDRVDLWIDRNHAQSIPIVVSLNSSHVIRSDIPRIFGRFRGAGGELVADPAPLLSHANIDLSKIPIADLQFVNGPLRSFLLTESIAQDSVIVDLSMTDGLASLVLARAFPRAKILLFAETVRDRCAAEGIISTARLDNIVLADMDQLHNILVAMQLEGAGADEDYLGALVVRNLADTHPKLWSIVCALAVDHAVPMIGEEIEASSVLDGLQGASQNSHFRVEIRGSSHVVRKDRTGVARRPVILDIVVAMYNSEQYIDDCLTSLLASGRKDIRILLVDDGSTDSSLEIVRSRFGSNPNLLILTKLNGGCASARNYGRIHSDASHIAFVDADDFVDPDFFPTLFDMARLSGNEIVQGGFLFHDSQTGEKSPSYETALFSERDRQVVLGKSFFRVFAEELMEGQPSIWRRVYRRDFLDSKSLFFPEHIRAFDDMIFHLLSCYYARDIHSCLDVNYHYRQHPSQDIKQGDERHFYELEMFHLMLRRAVREGWNDYYKFLASMINTANWSISSLREDLVHPFLRGLAKIFHMIRCVFGKSMLDESVANRISHADFSRILKEVDSTTEEQKVAFGAAYFDSILFHPSLMMMAKAT